MSKKIVTKLKDLPEAVREGAQAVKVLYFWLLGIPDVSLSIRQMAEMLGMDDKSIHRAYLVLKESGLLVESKKAVSNKPATFTIKKTD